MSNLIPEQRPDKNGNVVTRWVSSVWKQGDSSRSIPKVTISPSSISDSEATAIAERLYSFNAPTEAGDQQLLSKNTNAVKRCLESGDYRMLRVFDRIGRNHPYESILSAMVILGVNDHDDKISSLSDSQMHAYRSFQNCLDAAVRGTMRRKDNPDAHVQSIQLPIHVLLHPEDGPYMEAIVARGVFAKSQVLRLIDEMKEDQMHSAISEGFL